MRLAGRHALVTGGSRGIGRSIALALARAGADVVVNYRQDREAADSAVREVESLGRQAIAIQGDAASGEDVARLVAGAVAAMGSVDLLVCNAGVLRRTPFLEIPEAEWDWVLDTNLKGCFLVSQAVARHMVERGIRGAIIHVSSAGQERAGLNVTHYNVSKAAVGMLTRQMALELAPWKIRVNAVCPGLIETDLNRHDIASPEFREGRLARIPLKEIGHPDDVGGAVVFLAAEPEARLVTGACLFVDAGQTI
jgi:NAD(P)-dependent dehydrogenase (short-subunit alcohol dehydrogenase family)